MAHLAQTVFFDWVRHIRPRFFTNCRVLEVGSLNVNGTVRPLFSGCEYVGLDLGEGPGVDVVGPAHEYAAPAGSFDTVVSAECFEHDMHLPATLAAVVRLLRPGGLFAFTCANRSRPEHGTARTDPWASPFTSKIEGWCDYYRGLDEADIRAALDVDAVFPEHWFQSRGGDLYFYGIKAATWKSL